MNGNFRRGRRWLKGLALVWGGMMALAAIAADIRLERGGADEWPGLSVPAASGEVVAIEASSDLRTWTELLRGHGPLVGVPDLLASDEPSRFYRAWTRRLGAGDDGKNVIAESGDGFLSPEGEVWRRQSRWVKFALLLSEPHRVWFQDSGKYPFHYEFGTARLPGFSGMTRAQFDAVTLRTNGQRAVLGAVVFPPSTNIAEIGIQFVGLDAFPREQIAAWFETVQAMIQRRPGVQVLYLPTFEQAGVAREHEGWLASRGIRVSPAGRWVVGDECYAPGWALGRLRFVPGSEIQAAFGAGRLLADDILLTDQVPAEVPPLAGILSLAPATPNSHVALLSQSFGIPFAYPAEEALRSHLQAWTNREVMVRAVSLFDGCELTVEAIDGPIEPAVRAAIATLKVPAKLNVPAKVASSAISLPVQPLKPSDIIRVGGKAANSGVLRRRIPDNSPNPAMAFTFDLWDGFMDQVMPGGGTLRETLRGQLSGFTWPPDIGRLRTALESVRKTITDTADFSPAQRTEVLARLKDAGFDPTRPIRFRSSTNVEDGDQFSGAGLYDSFSGCLADDLDADAQGPSLCDPGEGKERGVFRALRKVYASFYNDNAFLERLRHGVDEASVGMAVLVHPSSPDDLEAANGVATLRVSLEEGRYVGGTLVSQAGAVSVTNPETTAVPETVSLFSFGQQLSLTLERQSSLVPLGGRVMTWESDYRKLMTLLNRAALGYEAEFPGRKAFVLDFEYKKLLPDGQLLVKQIREVPQRPERTYAPWLMATTNRFRVFQGEFGDVIANHRLKSEWEFRMRSTGLRDADLVRTPIVELAGTWRDGTRPVVVDGMTDGLPGHAFRLTAEDWSDAWTHGEGAGRRALVLRAGRIRETSFRDGPLLTLADHHLTWNVTYATDQPSLGYIPERDEFGPVRVREESVILAAVTPVTAESLRQERRIEMGGVVIRTAFWWPAPPKGPSAGYTAPMQSWIETRITGLTSREIVLRSDWAQTYHPGHHNFYEEFVFEPRLDPEVPADLVAELAARNVKALVVSLAERGFGSGYAYIWGLDDTLRKP